VFGLDVVNAIQDERFQFRKLLHINVHYKPLRPSNFIIDLLMNSLLSSISLYSGSSSNVSLLLIRTLGLDSTSLTDSNDVSERWLILF
jgi:hypothetical protein